MSCQSLGVRACRSSCGGPHSLRTLPATSQFGVQEAASHLQTDLGDPAAVFLISSADAQKVSMVAAFSPTVISQGLQAGKFIGGIAQVCGGGGGGRPNLAQAGGKDASKMAEALQMARQQLLDKL